MLASHFVRFYRKDVFASGCAVARSFSTYSRKTIPGEEDPVAIKNVSQKSTVNILHLKHILVFDQPRNRNCNCSMKENKMITYPNNNELLEYSISCKVSFIFFPGTQSFKT